MHGHTPPGESDVLSHDFTLWAWVDESIVLDRSARQYILAAAVGDPSSCGAIRDNLRHLVRRPRRWLHWRDEEPPDRRKIIEVIAQCDLVNMVVVGHPVEARRQERARRKCIERLMYLLYTLGVSRVALETRAASEQARLTDD